MKRTIGAFLASTVLVGCSTSGGGLSQHNANTGAKYKQQWTAAKQAEVQPAVARANGVSQTGDIQQVGYNHGHGAMQNNQFKQKIARAVPSHGGIAANGMQWQGGPGGGMGGPGCAADMGGMGQGAPGNLGPRFTLGRTQIRFIQPVGMKIAWQSTEQAVEGGFTEPQLQVPARYNFMQARIYRLKMTDIVNRPGMEVYPTVEVYPGNFKVDAYLAHNAVPVEFTEEDFDHIQAGNYVTKVIYLPDPKYQDLAIAGVETLVSTRLDPGVDPVQEAHRRGAILAVVRVGSVDLEMPHSPNLFQPPAMPAAMAAPVPSNPTMPAPGVAPTKIQNLSQGPRPATTR